MCFLWTAPNCEHIGCVFYESLHQTVYLVLECVSSESLPVFLPRIEWPTIQSAPTYMWALFFSLASQHNKQQWVPGLGMMMMTPSVQHCGTDKIQSSSAIFQSKTREISNPCMMLESTHQIKWWTGQGVHTVSSVWCRFIRDGTTLVDTSGIAHEHRQAKLLSLCPLSLYDLLM
jgi:hypothetical protein